MATSWINGTSQPRDHPIQLTLSNNSVRDTAITSEELGLRYDVSKKKGVITVQRLDPRTNQVSIIGEFKLPNFSKDLIRFGPTGPWIPLKEFLYKDGGKIFDQTKCFTGANGLKYRWKQIHGNSLALYDSMNNGGPLVKYHRHGFSGKPSYLEIMDTSVMSTLDSVIMTFLIMERKKRDADAAAAASG